MKKIVALVAAIFLLGCADKQTMSKIAVDCDKHAVIYDSFRVELLEIDESRGEIKTVVFKTPKNDVVGQAIFNCQAGALIFSTEERMKSDVTNTLYSLFKNGEKTTQFKYGINSILPYGDNKYIIREQIISGNKSDINGGNFFPDPFADFLDEDILKQKSIYMDDVIFDIGNFKILKKTNGTFDPTEYQNGTYLTYTSSRVVLKIDPENGSREILINYRKNRQQGGNLVDIPQLGARFFYLGGKFLVVNGESPENLINSGGKYLRKNTVFWYDKNLKNWAEIFHLDEKPVLTIFNNQKLIIVSRDDAFEYNYNTNALRQFKIPEKNYHWRSIGELNNSYIISGINEFNENSIFLASKDFKTFKLIRKDGDFSNPKISTKITPIPPKQILQ